MPDMRSANSHRFAFVAFWALLLVALVGFIKSGQFWVLPVLVMVVLEALAYKEVRGAGVAGTTSWLPLASWLSIAVALLLVVPAIVTFVAEQVLGQQVQSCFDNCDYNGGNNLFEVFIWIALGALATAVLAAIAWVVCWIQLLRRRRGRSQRASDPISQP